MGNNTGMIDEDKGARAVGIPSCNAETMFGFYCVLILKKFSHQPTAQRSHYTVFQSQITIPRSSKGQKPMLEKRLMAMMLQIHMEW